MLDSPVLGQYLELRETVDITYDIKMCKTADTSVSSIVVVVL